MLLEEVHQALLLLEELQALNTGLLAAVSVGGLVGLVIVVGWGVEEKRPRDVANRLRLVK